MASKLDANQILKAAYSDADGALKTIPAASTSFSIELDATDGDSVLSYPLTSAVTALASVNTGANGNSASIDVTNYKTGFFTFAWTVDASFILTFDTVPDAGSLVLDLGSGNVTSMDYSDNAAAIQTRIRTNFPAYTAVTVTGNFTIGFTFDFVGLANTQGLTLGTNTLTTTAVPVVVTKTAGTINGSAQEQVSLDGVTFFNTSASAIAINSLNGTSSLSDASLTAKYVRFAYTKNATAVGSLIINYLIKS